MIKYKQKKILAKDILNGIILYCLTNNKNNYVVTTSTLGFSAYYEGLRLYIRISETNTDKVTININNKGIKKILNKSGKDLIANTLLKNKHYLIVYNGNYFELDNEIYIWEDELKTNNKLIRPAINELYKSVNELFQSGVDLQNIAKSALDAAKISYDNDQLKTLVTTMANNLYTQDMKDKLFNAIKNMGGNADINNFW